MNPARVLLALIRAARRHVDAARRELASIEQEIDAARQRGRR